MACARGKANPTADTRIRLFADSAGYCQNPGCLRHLFFEAGKHGEMKHFAEMAHIVAAADGGPRSNPALNAAQRGSYDNLILLCVICHTMIDKAPDKFPDPLVRSWKQNRADILAGLFGTSDLVSRREVRSMIEPIMDENLVILQTYGPGSEASHNPESDMPELWRRKVLGTVIPNNKRIVAWLESNRRHMIDGEPKVLEEFRQHTDDLIARHLEDVSGGRRYPAALAEMMTGG